MIPPLNDQYWSERYQQGQTGWDLGQVSPPIATWFATVQPPLHSRILIPGCGNAYEAEWLYQQGYHHITLVDLSLALVQALQQRLQHLPGIEVVHQDFFAHQGHYDIMVEQTFFCALHPSLRPAYARHSHHLLQPNGLLVGVLFDTNFEGGPPFGGSEREYRDLLEPWYHLELMAPCYNSIPPRAGRELFIALRKKPT